MKKEKLEVAEKTYKSIEQWRKKYLPGFDFGDENQSLNKVDDKGCLSAVFNRYLSASA